jgi:hypothetical protein
MEPAVSWKWGRVPLIPPTIDGFVLCYTITKPYFKVPDGYRC